MSPPKIKFPLKMNMRKGCVEMTHGGGGRTMAQFVEELFMRHFDNDLLRQGNDQALFDAPKGQMVMSTDGHVVSPLFSPAAISAR